MRLAGRIAAGLPDARKASPRLLAPSACVPLRDMAQGCFVEAAATLPGRVAMAITRSPLAAALALASLDGIASRIVLAPPGLDAGTLAAAADLAEVDAIVSDLDDASIEGRPVHRIHATAVSTRPVGERSTEWALFTSGTSGAPKLVVHTLGGLTGAIARSSDGPRPVWATFYDVRRYGGLQMLLRALTGGCDLVMTEPDEPMAAFLARAAEAGVTHLAGTPTHWRRALMEPGLAALDLVYARLSGEIADPAILDRMATALPGARIVHAYASTEAGVGFEVADGRAGFPASLLEPGENGAVEMKLVDGVLHIRSERTAVRYLGEGAPSLRDADGFVDTGDMIEARGGRMHFAGRASGVVNVGGLKVHPEEVEAVINACAGVRLSRVSARRSPILGAVVAAEAVAEAGEAEDRLRDRVLARCREALLPHKVPASIRFVASLPLSPAGKLERRADV